MFVINIIMIVGILEGNAIRDNDIKYSTIAKHKAIRTPKVFAFFVGPVYCFNYVGSTIDSEGLPLSVTVVFYLVVAIWLVFMLAWAGYKLDLFPETWSPHTLNRQSVAVGVELDGSEYPVIHKLISYSAMFKKAGFTIYCTLVAGGFVGAILGKVAFSIFILGILVVAVTSLTLIFFIPLMWTLVQFFYHLPLNLRSRTYSCSLSEHVLIVSGK